MSDTTAPFYFDFRANNDDVNEFAQEPFSLTASHKTASGLTVSSSAKSVIKDNNQQPLVASVAPTYTFSEHNATAKFSLEQKVKDNKAAFAGAGLELQKEEPFGLKGSNVGVNVAYKYGKKTSVLVGGDFDYANHLVAATFAGEYGVYEGLTEGTVSVAFTHGHVSAGGAFRPVQKSKDGKAKSPKAEVGVLYQQEQYSAQLNGGFFAQKKTVDFDLYHKCASNNVYAVNVGAAFDEENQFKKVQASVATKYDINEETSVKGKVSWGKKGAHEARVNLALSSKLTPYATASVGANINALQVAGLGAGKPHSFGIQLSIE